MRVLVAVLAALLLPGGFHIGGALSSAQDCNPHCIQPQLPTDKICNFNNGDYCGEVVGHLCLCHGTCQQGLHTGMGNGYVIVGDDDLYSSDALEIELQVRPGRIPQPGESAGALVTKFRGQSAAESEWGLFVRPGGAFCLTGDGTESSMVCSAAGSVQMGVLYCVRALLLGSQGEIWVNGTRVAAGAIHRNPLNTATPVVIANSFQPGQANPYTGMLDELRIGTYMPSIGAVVDFDPDTLNQGSAGRFVTVYIELPDGFDVSEIDLATVRLNDALSPDPRFFTVGDHDGDGRPDLMIKFLRDAVIALLPVGDHVAVTISGRVGAVTFSGTDFIRVLPPPPPANVSRGAVQGVALPADR